MLDGRRLFAVNAGSNTISLLRVAPSGPVLEDVASSRGVRPISVTSHGRLVYVLNAGGGATPANIAGFWRFGGRPDPAAGLEPAAQRGAARPGADPVLARRAAARRHREGHEPIVTYAVGLLGYAGAPQVSPSAGQTPFGFAFDRPPPPHRLRGLRRRAGRERALVVRARAGGGVTPIDPNVATTETAACWVVVTGNGRYAYTTNTGSASVSGYAVGSDGDLTLLDADGKTATTGATPIDAALSHGSRFLYVLAGAAHEIDALQGERRRQPRRRSAPIGGLPAGSVGLAAR